jgi:hypothetical protein
MTNLWKPLNETFNTLEDAVNQSTRPADLTSNLIKLEAVKEIITVWLQANMILSVEYEYLQDRVVYIQDLIDQKQEALK